MVNNDKQKLLCLLKILWTRTDRQHILNSQDLIRILQDDYQCSSDRRTVYSNIDALIHAGFKIKQVKGNTHGYYMEERILILGSDPFNESRTGLFVQFRRTAGHLR